MQAGDAAEKKPNQRSDACKLDVGIWIARWAADCLDRASDQCRLGEKLLLTLWRSVEHTRARSLISELVAVRPMS